MFALFCRRHPFERVQSRLLRLTSKLEDVCRKLEDRDRLTDGNRVVSDLVGRRSSFRSLHQEIQMEASAWSHYKAISITGERAIRSSFNRFFNRFTADLQRIDRVLCLADPSLARQLRRKLHPAVEKLGSAIGTLQQEVSSWRIMTVDRHGFYRKEFLKVREAMATLDKEAAKELTGREVDGYVEWPGFDPYNFQEVLRIAKLLLLAVVDEQVFELRIRSNAPGQPLPWVSRRLKFPEKEAVMEVVQLPEKPRKIYVAATKPTWRIVWVFDLDNGPTPW